MYVTTIYAFAKKKTQKNTNIINTQNPYQWLIMTLPP